MGLEETENAGNGMQVRIEMDTESSVVIHIHARLTDFPMRYIMEIF
jgi:hypothetical protein